METSINAFISHCHRNSSCWMTLVSTRTFYKNWLRKKVMLFLFIIQIDLVKLITPTFVSTVEVEVEVSTGQEAKTKKKLAEMSAAKVAYLTLKERMCSKNFCCTHLCLLVRLFR
ncbi:uncharacterized protein LOC116134524 [Pistacia vera]|uniref:uncharacterized protein LOC116134524 n=1 Tax=Pistacia vera TaxID=55513 RepID=UPI001263E3A8|nr:uncharacterized protein LOC116134524 [Pistacia vera]